MCNMPEKHSIKAESITDVYAEIMELNSAIDIGCKDAERITIASTLTPKAGAVFAFAIFSIKFRFI